MNSPYPYAKDNAANETVQAESTLLSIFVISRLDCGPDRYRREVGLRTLTFKPEKMGMEREGEVL